MIRASKQDTIYKGKTGQSITVTICSDLIYAIKHVSALTRTYTKITCTHDDNFYYFISVTGGLLKICQMCDFWTVRPDCPASSFIRNGGGGSSVSS
jgi:hypothetical protein